MKKILFILSIILSCATFASDSVQVTLATADSAYMDEQYRDALEIWENYSDSTQIENADLYYNMGNAAWRLKQPGRAILYWNKALKLNPDMEDARYNLDLTKETIVDRIDPVEESQIEYWLNRFITFLSPKSWGILGVSGFVLMLISVVIFKRTNSGFSSYFLPIAILFCIMGGVAIGAGAWHQNRLDNTITAVVIKPNIYVKSAPMIGGGDAFILHEGTQMLVTKELGNWYEIKLADGKVGWVQDGEVGVF